MAWYENFIFQSNSKHGHIVVKRYNETGQVWDTIQSLSCCCSVAHSCPTLCNPMDCSTPGFHVLHHLLELAQTHVHRAGDTIHPSCDTEYESGLVVLPIRNGSAAVSGSCQLSRGFQDYQLQLSESASKRTGIFALNQRTRTPIWYVVLEAEARIGPDLVTVEAKTRSLDFRLNISSSLFSTYH